MSRRCEVCWLVLPGAVGPTTCEDCLTRASENRNGLHGREVQAWQRKVDAVIEIDLCSVCGDPAHASETDDLDRHPHCAS